jgi:hypothetical protein
MANPTPTPPPAPIIETVDSVDALLDFIERHRPLQLSIYQITPQGRRAFVTTTDAQGWSQDKFAADYPGGGYFLQVKDKGKVLKSARFDIAAKPNTPPAFAGFAPSPPPPLYQPAAAAPAGDGMMPVLVALIQSQGQQAVAAQQNMMALMATMMSKSTGPTIGEILALVKDNSGASSIRDMLRVAKEINGERRTDEEEDRPGMLGEVIRQYGPALLDALKQPPAQAAHDPRGVDGPHSPPSPDPALPASPSEAAQPAPDAPQDADPARIKEVWGLDIAPLVPTLRYIAAEELEPEAAAVLINAKLDKMLEADAAKLEKMIADSGHAEAAQAIGQLFPATFSSPERIEHLNRVFEALLDTFDAEEGDATPATTTTTSTPPTAKGKKDRKE